jgi:cytochrome P450
MMAMPTLPVAPAPPRVAGRLPFVGAGLAFLRNPTEFLCSTRARLGDSFLVEAFGFRLFFLFSPEGLRSLYALPEKEASFTEATRTLIGFKLPPELLGGDMSMFHHLFGRDQLEGYRAWIEAAVEQELAQLGAEGELEVFAHMKRLVHRIGFRCWAGPEAASPAHLPRLIELFEALDPEQAFVHPARIFVTLATRKAPERRALAQVREILSGIWRERERRGAREGDMLESLHDLYRDSPEPVRHERVARDVIILHLASQSNLYAAISWTLVNLLLHPRRQAAAREDPARLEACALESIRLAQRSLTLRKVMQPCRVSDGATEYLLQPGVYVATLLSVGNQASAELAEFDPDHYERGRPADRLGLPTRESVSTFGHGSHACPGRRFALAAIGIAVSAYLARLELTPLFQRADPKPGQMGAVARAAEPCPLLYRRRGGDAGSVP